MSSSCLDENALWISEENGQTGSRWQKGNSNNHSLTLRYAENHLWTHNTSKIEAGGLQQQKTTPGATYSNNRKVTIKKLVSCTWQWAHCPLLASTVTTSQPIEPLWDAVEQKMPSCQNGPKSLRNFSNTLLKVCHEELMQFWRQKGSNLVQARCT